VEIKVFDFAINESVIFLSSIVVDCASNTSYICAPFIFIFKIRLYMPLSFKTTVMYPINSKFCDFSIGPCTSKMYSAEGKKNVVHVTLT
jgi:hypothetical protein